MRDPTLSDTAPVTPQKTFFAIGVFAAALAFVGPSAASHPPACSSRNESKQGRITLTYIGKST